MIKFFTFKKMHGLMKLVNEILSDKENKENFQSGEIIELSNFLFMFIEEI